MTGEPQHPNQNQARHLIALGAGVAVLLAFFVNPGGVVGYLVMIALGIVAAFIGHSAARRQGPLLWAAIIGLVLSYIELITALGLLVVRLSRLGV